MKSILCTLVLIYIVKPYKEKDIAPAVALALSNNRFIKKKYFQVSFINQSLDRGLIPQEYKVLKLLYDGSKKQQIAKLLFVSVNTVKTHVGKIYSKLETNSRAGAINEILNL